MPTTMTETPVAASSSSNNNGGSPDRKQLEEQFESLMSGGKRCFHCGEFEKAVESFEEACKVKADLCGENSHELAEVYYYYGSALLDLGRQEQGVLGEKVVNKEDDLAEEDSDDAAAAAEPQVEGNGSAAQETEEEGEDNGEEEEEEEEEITNMQIAWEMFELARTYYQKKEMTDDVYKMIAKCLEKLGDWGLENESYDQTIANMTDCIEIYEKILPVSDRRFASAYYCLGVAHCELKNFQDSQKSMNKSLEVLEKNIQALNGKIESSENDEKKTESLKEEMSELNGLMTEIKHKLEDMADLKKSYLKSLFDNGGGAASTSGAGSSSGTGSSAGTGSSSSFGFNVPEQKPSSSSFGFNVPEQKPSSSSFGFNAPEQEPTSSSFGFNAPEQEPTSASSSSSAALFKSAYKEENAADISHLMRRKRCSDGEKKPSMTTTSQSSGDNASSSSSQVATKKRRVQLS